MPIPNLISRNTVLRDLSIERDRQERLKAEGRFTFTCADPQMSDFECLAVLAEEFGEVARAILERAGHSNDLHGVELRKELIQVAAVAVAWVEKLDAGAVTL